MSRTVKGSKGPGYDINRKPKRGYYPRDRFFKNYVKRVARRIGNQIDAED